MTVFLGKRGIDGNFVNAYAISPQLDNLIIHHNATVHRSEDTVASHQFLLLIAIVRDLRKGCISSYYAKGKDFVRFGEMRDGRRRERQSLLLRHFVMAPFLRDLRVCIRELRACRRFVDVWRSS
ncbi:hypothetical protein KIN20_005733 [Parelaphostrongylus tenuis]|uniref:Uncharacterized protein n=1 Tax=Parelaphostrongylus tenuis TaxID=148309 RepID=A0AAD5MJ62_PARTN|nr:hypothetical protein KIN20_005733 [Parelaphostrongylus tenuis]